jgi:hypothetical protein
VHGVRDRQDLWQIGSLPGDPTHMMGRDELEALLRADCVEAAFRSVIGIRPFSRGWADHELRSRSSNPTSASHRDIATPSDGYATVSAGAALRTGPKEIPALDQSPPFRKAGASARNGSPWMRPMTGLTVNIR